MLLQASFLCADTIHDYTKFMDFELNKSRFNDVQEILGETKVDYSGQQGTSKYTICYSWDLDSKISISFKSIIFHFDYSGGNHWISAVKLEKHDKSLPTNCMNPEIKTFKLPKIGKITLGMNRNDVKSNLQNVDNLKLVSSNEAKDQYEYHKKVPFRDTLADLLITVKVWFRMNQVSRIEIWRTETL